MILHVREKEKDFPSRDIIGACRDAIREKRARVQARRVPGARPDVLACSRRSIRDGARIAITDDEIDSLTLFDLLRGTPASGCPRFTVYPSSHYVTAALHDAAGDRRDQDRSSQRRDHFQKAGKASRGPADRAAHALRLGNAEPSFGDLQGIENYSRTCPEERKASAADPHRTTARTP